MKSVFYMNKLSVGCEHSACRERGFSQCQEHWRNVFSLELLCMFMEELQAWAASYITNWNEAKSPVEWKSCCHLLTPDRQLMLSWPLLLSNTVSGTESTLKHTLMFVYVDQILSVFFNGVSYFILSIQLNVCHFQMTSFMASYSDHLHLICSRWNCGSKLWRKERMDWTQSHSTLNDTLRETQTGWQIQVKGVIVQTCWFWSGESCSVTDCCVICKLDKCVVNMHWCAVVREERV